MTTSLSLFTITIVGSNESFTNQIYANGNQQVTVNINVVKTVNGMPQPLTQEEKDSVTVVEYSSNINASLPTGWFCDTTRNRYDQGLRGSTYGAATVAARNGASDVISRYMRCDGRVQPLMNYQFMARIKVDGTLYTTHFDSGMVAFESKITIAPQRPYVITVGELSSSRQDALTKEWQKGDHIDVDTYYWTLPSALRILGESFENAGYWGDKLYYAYAINASGAVRLGMAIRLGVTSLTLGDIGNTPGTSHDSTQVPLVNSDRMLRAARYACDGLSASPTYDNYMKWTITDNLGCRSPFILKSNRDDNGNTLQLIDG